MHSILVKDYMDKDPHAVKQTATVRDAIAMLVEHKITGAPIVDERNTLVGFVSEHDCIANMLNEAFYRQESPEVASIMRTNLKTVMPDTSMLEVAEAMSAGPPKNYPVVDEGKLVGLISRAHILKALLTVNDD